MSDAKGQLTDLVKRAEAGDEVVLLRHGQAVARLVPMKRKPLTVEERRKILREIRASVVSKANKGPSAARSQDFLYDEYGLPK